MHAIHVQVIITTNVRVVWIVPLGLSQTQKIVFANHNITKFKDK
jgi:hypothetical protein